MSPAWTIGGQVYPDADPVEIRRGEGLRFRMRNMSIGLHPMHLHGHLIRVGRAWKDTVSPSSSRRTWARCRSNSGPITRGAGPPTATMPTTWKWG